MRGWPQLKLTRSMMLTWSPSRTIKAPTIKKTPRALLSLMLCVCVWASSGAEIIPSALVLRLSCGPWRLLTDANLPIGVFDSGVGGLTVLAALRRHLPGEDFIYLGDTARLPYGTKSAATVERYALVARGIKVLVVACNTASATALWFSRVCSHAVFGVVEPGALAACR